MSDYTVIEAGDILATKKKKKKLPKEDKPKKKKKKVKPDEDKPKKKKKKLSDDKPKKKKTKSLDGKPKKKKKKAKTTELSVVNSVNTEVEDLGYSEDQISSQFDAEYQRLLETSGVEDRDQIEAYNIMFRKLQMISRKFEEKSISGSSKDVYALMKVYDQMREVIADMKALRDISTLADSIQSQSLLPFCRNVVQEMSSLRAMVLKTSKVYLQPKDIAKFEDAVNQQFQINGANLQEAYELARQSIVDIYMDQ